MNGYVHHPSTKYKWDELKKYEFNCVFPSYGNGVYLMSEQIEPIVNESIMRNFGETIQTGYGILNDKFKTMDVCYITDDNYAKITSKSIQSLASCVNPNTHYVIHVICDNVSELNKVNLLLNARHNVDVKLVDYSPSQFIPKRLLENRGDKITHVTNAAMIKFNICNILSYLDTVLYVDGDVVFVNDPVTV